MKIFRRMVFVCFFLSLAAASSLVPAQEPTTKPAAAGSAPLPAGTKASAAADRGEGDKPTTSRSVGTSPLPVYVDPDFLDSLGQLRALGRELAELRAQVKALEGRLAARNQEIRQWVVEHQVPADWRYDETLRAFQPPVPVPSDQRPALNHEGSGPSTGEKSVGASGARPDEGATTKPKASSPLPANPTTKPEPTSPPPKPQ